jgi:hypothetical protein
LARRRQPDPTALAALVQTAEEIAAREGAVERLRAEQRTLRLEAIKQGRAANLTWELIASTLGIQRETAWRLASAEEIEARADERSRARARRLREEALRRQAMQGRLR